MRRLAFIHCALALAFTTVAAAPIHAKAQQVATDYPARASRIIVQFPPGGALDTLGRMVPQYLSNAWSQRVVVENRPGAVGNIGAEAVANAAPDGYTLTLASAGFMAVNPPAQFDTLIRSEITKYATIVKSANIKSGLTTAVPTTHRQF